MQVFAQQEFTEIDTLKTSRSASKISTRQTRAFFADRELLGLQSRADALLLARFYPVVNLGSKEVHS